MAHKRGPPQRARPHSPRHCTRAGASRVAHCQPSAAAAQICQTPAQLPQRVPHQSAPQQCPRPFPAKAAPRPRQSIAAPRPRQSIAAPRPRRAIAAPRPRQPIAAPRPRQPIAAPQRPATVQTTASATATKTAPDQKAPSPAPANGQASPPSAAPFRRQEQALKEEAGSFSCAVITLNGKPLQQKSARDQTPSSTHVASCASRIFVSRYRYPDNVSAQSIARVTLDCKLDQKSLAAAARAPARAAAPQGQTRVQRQTIPVPTLPGLVSAAHRPAPPQCAPLGLPTPAPQATDTSSPGSAGNSRKCLTNPSQKAPASRWRCCSSTW